MARRGVLSVSMSYRSTYERQKEAVLCCSSLQDGYLYRLYLNYVCMRLLKSCESFQKYGSSYLSLISRLTHQHACPIMRIMNNKNCIKDSLAPLL
jgi:hypothetical protein